MARYKCSVCGYVYDEEKEGKPFSELTECPVCHQPREVFEKLAEKPTVPEQAESGPLAYPAG